VGGGCNGKELVRMDRVQSVLRVYKGDGGVEKLSVLWESHDGVEAREEVSRDIRMYRYTLYAGV
jgi:hypothetical protein